MCLTKLCTILFSEIMYTVRSALLSGRYIICIRCTVKCSITSPLHLDADYVSDVCFTHYEILNC